MPGPHQPPGPPTPHVPGAPSADRAETRTSAVAVPEADPDVAPAANGTEAPLQGLSFALAGPGRVGSSLARWMVARGAVPRAIGYHRRGDEAEALAAELAAEVAGWPESAAGGASPAPRVVPLPRLESADADVLLVAVADPALDAVAALLAARPQAPVALHVAGSRGASALEPLAGGGCATGTLHPLKAFPHALPSPAAGRGVTFGVDGAPAAVALAERLARSWEAVPVPVPEAGRDLYHLAATLAAGGVVTLLAAAQRIAGAGGVPPEVLGGYLELARGALEGAGEALGEEGGVAGAITGPAARGDLETVDRHLRALAGVRPELTSLVALLARETLCALAEGRSGGTSGLSPDQRRLLRALEAVTPLPGDESGRGLC